MHQFKLFEKICLFWLGEKGPGLCNSLDNILRKY
jgi:hypothetical protein